MARVERKDSWRVAGDAEAILRRVAKYMTRQGMTYEMTEDGGVLVLEGAQGSQLKTRLLGGWWVSAETLPKKAVVEVEQTSRGCRVRAVLEETMGFGWLDPILADKYGAYFDRWLDELEEELEPCPEPDKERRARARKRTPDERIRGEERD